MNFKICQGLSKINKGKSIALLRVEENYSSLIDVMN